MTGYVATRYYRAPEIMLTWRKYDAEVDIWSAACIFAEMIEGKPLFPGKDHVHQFSMITELLGTPSEDVCKTISSENVSPKPVSPVQMGTREAGKHLLTSSCNRPYNSSTPSQSASANHWPRSSKTPMQTVCALHIEYCGRH